MLCDFLSRHCGRRWEHRLNVLHGGRRREDFGNRGVFLRVYSVQLLPVAPATQQHLKLLRIVALIVDESARHTGAFILGRSLAVRYDQLVLWKFAQPRLGLAVGDAYRPCDMALVVSLLGAYIND